MPFVVTRANAPDNPLVVFVSILGLFPMVYPACFLLGVLVSVVAFLVMLALHERRSWRP